jgi:hypothetical protein
MANSSINLPAFHNAKDPLPPSLVEKKHLDDATAVIVRALEAGCPKRFAAHLAGYSEHWIYNKSKDDLDFATLVEAAVARGVEARVGRINGHARRHWQADAWMLSRTHPKEFAEPAVALNQQLSLSTGPTNIVVVGPERASVLATRHESIRAKTRELLERNDGNGDTQD